jgi:hypothetical protein
MYPAIFSNFLYTIEKGGYSMKNWLKEQGKELIAEVLKALSDSLRKK